MNSGNLNGGGEGVRPNSPMKQGMGLSIFDMIYTQAIRSLILEGYDLFISITLSRRLIYLLVFVPIIDSVVMVSIR